MQDERTEVDKIEKITVDLDPGSLHLLRTYQKSEDLPDLSIAAWHLLMVALIQWELIRRRTT